MTVLSFFRRTPSIVSIHLIIALFGLTVLVATPCGTPVFAAEITDVVASGLHDDCQSTHGTQTMHVTHLCCDQLDVLSGPSPDILRALARHPAPSYAPIKQLETARDLRNAWAVLKLGSPPPVYLATQRLRI